MTREQAVWLKEEFIANHQGKILKGATLNAYYEAERILRGKDKIDRRGCSCQHKDLSKAVNSMIDQYTPNINQLYDEKEQSDT